MQVDCTRKAQIADISCSAVFSSCRRYRYELWRRWSDDPICVFVGLNPSTADELHDDPTIRKCVGYSKKWGYGSLCMVNLFAFRATLPQEMLAVTDPVGPCNDLTLKRVAVDAGIVIAAWGNDGGHLRRDKAVIAMLPKLHCLKQNKDGSPAHPLYLRGDLMPYPLTRPPNCKFGQSG